jgi:hypothetical protein
MSEVKVLQLTASGNYSYAHEIETALAELYKRGFVVKATFAQGNNSYAILDREIK